jgi:hypothetical protein
MHHVSGITILIHASRKTQQQEGVVLNSVLVRRLATASVLVLSMTAWGSNTPSASESGEKLCPKPGKRNGLTHCTKLFKGGKPIRLPGDPSDTQRYGAVKRSGDAFYTRAGDVRLSDAVVKQLSKDAGSGHAAYANTIYLATISNGAVTKLKPIADISEDAVLDALFAGRVMEGTIDTLAGPDTYTSGKRLPIRIEFARKSTNGRLAGKITNSTGKVRRSDGACLKPLAGRASNPLVGPYTANVEIQRFPSMHAQFDDELLLSWREGVNNMGRGFYPSVATLLGGDPLARTWETVIHGTPTAGPGVDLHFVKGGGGAC